ncbi:MAG: AzlD domain-containing protein [Pseudomonadota bacterium]
MPAETVAVLTIIGVALVTLSTRVGGFWLMSHVTVTPALEAFLRALASSVVVAAIAPAVWHGDWAVRIAVAAATVVMIVCRQVWIAMIAGIAVASLWRLFVP